MAKRFTDTGKWDHAWFRKLTPRMKCAWIFLCDRCDHAGIWTADFDSLSFHVGEEISSDELTRGFGEKIRSLSNDKFLIQSFVDFQYGELNLENRVHKSVVSRLQKEGAYKDLKSPSQRAKDKDKDKDKDKIGECEGKKEFHPLASLWNESCGELRKVREISEKRRKSISARIDECSDLDVWRGVIQTIAKSDWCNARHEKNKTWKATFDFLLQPETRIKALEGQYDNAGNGSKVIDL